MPSSRYSYAVDTAMSLSLAKADTRVSSRNQRSTSTACL